MHVALVDFEFDPAKSTSNLFKHGIDFIAAQALWQDAELVILPSPYPFEERFILIGKIGEKHWTAVFTERGERIRIISVRRTRDSERQIYGRH
jgi:uncharacterized protein